MKNTLQQSNIPLVVDLDGTFVKTDVLIEAIILLLKKNPLYIFHCFFWYVKGALFFKQKVFSLVTINHQLLPINEKVWECIQVAVSQERAIILATASLQTEADAIQQLYPFFEKAYGSISVNLKGIEKANLLNDIYGKKQYDYIGDSKADIPIFKNARQSLLVNGSASLKNKVKSVSDNVIFLDAESQIFLESIKAIRIYQWVKNNLLFIPLITSHLFFTTHLISQAVFGFFAFSFVASAGYLLNDLFDVNADRIHPRKKMRPFAAGSLSITYGISLAFSLLLVGGILASLISISFILILLVYFVISFTYSLYFKKIILYDVFVLAILYTIRVFAGGIATEIPISFWLIAFSTFLFLSLAFVKRYAELMKSNEVQGLMERGRAYFSGDLMLLQIMGIVSGFLSVIVFSLYIDSNEVKQLYTSPRILWGTSLLFLFWISRVWVETNRGKMTDDPIVYAIKDKTSYFIFIGIAIIMFIAK